MTFEQHKKIHEDLHKGLLQLLQDYINVTGKDYTSISVMELVGWSSIQSISPTPTLLNQDNQSKAEPVITPEESLPLQKAPRRGLLKVK